MNLASGAIYSQVLVSHWRVYRKQGHWLSQHGAERWNDRVNGNHLLYAHSVDAAQQGFYKACMTTRSLRKQGKSLKGIEVQFPHRRKRYRTTVWKQSGIRVKDGNILLSRARGLEPLSVAVPDQVKEALEGELYARVLEVRLVYCKKAHRYFWHIVYENGKPPKEPQGTNVVAVDLGEVHPAVVTDEQEATLVTCRERRHEIQGFNKRLAQITQAMARKQTGSRAWHRLRKAKDRLKAKHKRVLRDMEHKISRAVVNVAVERKARTIVVGDIRNVADEVQLGKQTNQKVSQWSHGKVVDFIRYKAEAEGIAVERIGEAYSSQTCPNPDCNARHKPRNRNYSCRAYGTQAHRDVVGAVNILSKYRHGKMGQIPVPPHLKQRRPSDEPVSLRWRMRRRQGIGQVGEIQPVACNI